ncbi:hypothetical protein [Phyllobacterium salinisoli]|uniref:hypothetical protein n=1 Tax=Phyllobacterium salinisoli TaxID=1899321 RepID=UPI0011C02393|nr:hypothetical protein [Phyllobacterium salinisoli]
MDKMEKAASIRRELAATDKAEAPAWNQAIADATGPQNRIGYPRGSSGNGMPKFNCNAFRIDSRYSASRSGISRR